MLPCLLVGLVFFLLAECAFEGFGMWRDVFEGKLEAGETEHGATVSFEHGGFVVPVGPAKVATEDDGDFGF